MNLSIFMIHCSLRARTVLSSDLNTLCQLTPEHLHCSGKWLTLSIANTVQETSQDISEKECHSLLLHRIIHVVYTNSFATAVVR